MATTVTIVKNLGYGENGKRKEVIADIAYSGVTYSSGLTVTGGDLGLPNVIESLTFVDSTPSDSKVWKWDGTNSKIRGFTSSTGSELSGSTTVTIRVKAVGW